MKYSRKLHKSEKKKKRYNVEPLITVIMGIIIGALMNILYFYYFGYLSSQVISNSDFMLAANSTRIQISDKSLSDTELHHVLFGVRGSTDTWNKRRHFSKLWWMPFLTRGFVWFENPLPDDYVGSESSPPYKVLGRTKSFYTSGSRNSVQHIQILKETVDLNEENVRWIVLGDDDTVFFPDNLVTVLKKYDHNELYYIGGISESVEQNIVHSNLMAYTGGGCAISFNLAKEIASIFDSYDFTLPNGKNLQLHDFISELGVPLTLEKGFHQVDLRGEIYGFLAAHPVAPLVSLHHLDYVKPAISGMSEVESIAKLNQAYKVDPGRTLQQCFCFDKDRNWTISVSWGYTVQIYGGFLSPQLLEKKLLTFRTWEVSKDRTWHSKEDRFTFDTRPVPVNNTCAKPVIYFADQTSTENYVQSLTTYKRFTDQAEGNCNEKARVSSFRISYVKVFARVLKQKYWHKVPRRQCCEVVGVQRDVLVVKIRRCKPLDNVIPS